MTVVGLFWLIVEYSRVCVKNILLSARSVELHSSIESHAVTTRTKRPRCPPGHEASPGAVMALAPSASPPEARPLRLLLLLSLVMAVGCAGCKLDLCSRKYEEESDQGLGQCEALTRYSTCVRGTARACRGNLKYHSTNSILTHQMNEFNCSAGGPSPRPPTQLPPPRSTIPPQTCAYQGRSTYRHCGLFGDPHLKTFYGEYQTCRVRGAWPLLDNPYLAVQVTNEPVREASQATATTKVTIIIRGRNSSPCAHEKTYQATSDGPLPTTFIDGTQRSGGPEESIVLTAHDSQHVEIYLRYIDSTLIVRQAGSYLAFSARMPDDLLRLPGEDLQLCMRGCPPSELLDPVRSRGDALPWSDALERCRRADNYNLNLTDHYLDWCVFDVMTTGDGEAADFFTAAAYHAQADVIRLDPGSLKNRMEPNNPEPAGVSGMPSVTRTLVAASLLIALHAWL